MPENKANNYHTADMKALHDLGILKDHDSQGRRYMGSRGFFSAL